MSKTALLLLTIISLSYCISHNLSKTHSHLLKRKIHSNLNQVLSFLAKPKKPKASKEDCAYL